MQVLSTSSTRTLNFTTREEISGSKTYSLVIKSEELNKVIFTDSNATLTAVDYYYTYSTTQALTEANFYTYEIRNTTDNTLIYRDKIFATDQTLSTFNISNNVYTESSTGDNEYIFA
tara:strand:+ start:2923 stop:3273 length:351 start_codon:yes stop_codon:yes gene_type:complete